MRQPFEFQEKNKSAFALIITIIILALLAIMAVAFLSTSRVERGTAKGVADTVKAQMLAQTAVNAAIVQLIDNLSKFPDSATTWETLNGNPATIIYYRTDTPEKGAGSPMNVLPLISGATAQPIASKTSSVPATINDSNSFDLNRARFSGDTQGWIGAPPGAATRPSYRGVWVNVNDSAAKLSGRYAYWMEDESFKCNVNLMGNTLRGSNTLGNAPSQIPLQGLYKVALTTGDPNIIANDTVTLRSGFPASAFFEFRALNQVNGQPTLADSSKFEATIYSGTSNLSRSGSKRVNLNKVVADSTDKDAIRTQLDQIIKPITYHLPNFGQRFYRNGSNKNSLDVSTTGAPSHQTIYLNKIAANIRDYIDTDSQPTIVNNDAGTTVRIGAAPTRALLAKGGIVPPGENEVIAIGKESVPVIQEYMLRVKQIDFGPTRTGASATYKIEIDHYLEVWNMTNKDITVADLGPNPFWRIANQFGWDALGGTNIPAGASRDFSVPLASFTNSGGASLVFPAGDVTVLTTDPSPLPATFTGVDPNKIFRPPIGTPANQFRVYSGTTTLKNSNNWLRLNSITRPVQSSSAGDYQTELILGNDNGLLESFGSPYVWYMTINIDDQNGTSVPKSERFDLTKWYFRSSYLKGNVTFPFDPAIASQTADPRTNNEQLSFDSSSSVAEDQTGYKRGVYRDDVPYTSTFTVANTPCNPAAWIDPSSNTPDSAHAPIIFSNSPLTSIGQLGQVFDPARAVGPSPDGSGNIRYSRGGGRTFKIGQPDDLWDGNSNSASREWTAWRLADVFSTTDSVQLDGRININGTNRDNGVALKAALYGYSFAAVPDSDPSLAGKTFDADPANATDKINALITQIQKRLGNQNPFNNTAGPFAERGELSELPMFNTGSDLASGVNTSSVFDRGREELFRRLVELTTTRGNVFTVYAVGQSLVPPPGGASPVVTSTSQVKVTFRITPKWNAGLPTDPFDPSTTDRFKKPDKYEIKVLYVGE